jgi:YHS domain-containing protein
MVKDPVCGKEIGYKRFNECSEYKGRTYYFRSNACKIRFDNNPSEYEVKVIIKKRSR